MKPTRSGGADGLGAEFAENLAAARRLIAAAAAAGARLVALPENFYIIGRHESDKVKLRERDGDGPIQDFPSPKRRGAMGSG